MDRIYIAIVYVQYISFLSNIIDKLKLSIDFLHFVRYNKTYYKL